MRLRNEVLRSEVDRELDDNCQRPLRPVAAQKERSVWRGWCTLATRSLDILGKLLCSTRPLDLPLDRKRYSNGEIGPTL